MRMIFVNLPVKDVEASKAFFAALGFGHNPQFSDETAACIVIDENIFADPYAVPRTIRNLIASTPVGKARAVATHRISLVETILKTDLLTRPVWAA